MRDDTILLTFSKDTFLILIFHVFSEVLDGGGGEKNYRFQFCGVVRCNLLFFSSAQIQGKKGWIRPDTINELTFKCTPHEVVRI